MKGRVEEASSSKLKGKAAAKNLFHHEGHEELEVKKSNKFYHEEHEALEEKYKNILRCNKPMFGYLWLSVSSVFYHGIVTMKGLKR